MLLCRWRGLGVVERFGGNFAGRSEVLQLEVRQAYIKKEVSALQIYVLSISMVGTCKCLQKAK